MTMGVALVDVITAGRKRTFADITEETRIVLNDGRKGTYKPSKKHKGGWFYEANSGSESAADREWLNQDELEEMVRSQHPV